MGGDSLLLKMFKEWHRLDTLHTLLFSYTKVPYHTAPSLTFAKNVSLTFAMFCACCLLVSL